VKLWFQHIYFKVSISQSDTRFTGKMSTGDEKPSGGGPKDQKKQDSSTFKKAAVPRKFEGNCDDLKGNIYNCSDAKQADIFIKTTKVIAEYVGRTYKYGGDVMEAVEKLEVPVLSQPGEPPATATKTELRIWEKEVDEFVYRKTRFRENIKSLYALVWGQCSDIMRQKVEASSGYGSMSGAHDGLKLLITIKEIVYQFHSSKFVMHAVHDATRRFYMYSQGKHTTTAVYLEQYQNIIDVIQQVGGSVGKSEGLVQAYAKTKGVDTKTMSDKERTALEQEAYDRYLATSFILASDRSRYGRLIEGLENDYLQGYLHSAENKY
jgi:hypothetical protein